MKFASLFTGFGGADIGAMQAGLEPIWGVEIDRDIARVAERNLHSPVIVEDVCKVFESPISREYKPNWIHASPPCINASRAKNGKETIEDMKLSNAICTVLRVLEPDYFSLENVVRYADFTSFKSIVAALSKLDYNIVSSHIDGANCGLPQSRKRLFLVASKKKFSDYIFKNVLDHEKLMGWEKPMGWYEAIADLIPTLKKTTLTQWQKKALLSEFSDTKFCYEIFFEHDYCENLPNLAIQRSGARKKNGIPNNTIRLWDEPMFTIKAMSGKVRPNVNQVTLIIDGVPYEADPRCLARWQSFPDWYQLPEDKKLAVKGLGNAVPPLIMQKIIEAVLT